jgi:hypothetical protein
MKHVIVSAFLALVVSCAGSGTETDNPASPLENFSSSGCKNKEPSPGQQALERETDADGLTCVEWARDTAGALDLKLYNFSEPCGETYLGKAAFDAAGALEVSVYQDTCAVARCGQCVFDFHFELQSVPADAPLALRIGSAICESQPTIFSDELTLPVDTQESGVVCRRLDRGALDDYAGTRGLCGAANMPCGAACSGAAGESCGTSATCTELAPSDSRCLTNCTTDDDCPSGLTTCVDGACQAAASW